MSDAGRDEVLWPDWIQRASAPFGMLSGHREAWDQWVARLEAGNVPHSLLLAGPAGVGKRPFAYRVVKSLICKEPRPDRQGCGVCRGCKALASGIHADARFVSFEMNYKVAPPKLRDVIVVEQVRALREALSQTSQMGGWKVAVIDPAEAMNENSANALLKTLEEPTERTLLLLVADRPSLLPATIRSRCQRIELRFPPRAEALAWLVAGGLAEAAAAEALDLAAGNPGLAREYAEPSARARLEATVRDLVAVGSGKASAQATAAGWLKDKDTTEAAARLLLAAQSVRVAAWAVRGQGGASKTLAPLAGLTAGADFPKLAAWWDRANGLREQLRQPLKHDLLLLELLRDFRAAVQPPRVA